MYPYLTWAKKRIDQMDASLASRERMVKKAKSRSDTAKLLADLKKRRDHFAITARQMKSHVNVAEARMRKLSAAGADSCSAFRIALVKSRKVFARANRKAGKAIKRAVR
jgi:chlorite dismutase